MAQTYLNLDCRGYLDNLSGAEFSNCQRDLYFEKIVFLVHKFNIEFFNR